MKLVPTFPLPGMRFVVLVAVSLALACGGGGEVTTPPPPPPGPAPIAAITLAPDSSDLDVGGTLQLAATVKDAGGAVLTGRTLQWSSTDPLRATISGTGLVSAVAPGKVTITASAEGKSGTAVIRVLVAADTLAGATSSSGVEAIPLRTSPSLVEAEFTTGSPEQPHAQVSTRNLLVLVKADATLGQLNALLRVTHGQIVAGSPGISGQVPGLIGVRLPTFSHGEMASMITLLRQQAIVVHAYPDMRVGTHRVTSANALPAEYQWTWDLTPKTANWGLEAIRAPSLWNLNDAIQQRGGQAEVAVFDVGFEPSEDVQYARQFAPSYRSSHGVHVSGIIAAQFNNGKGIDGVNPFTRLVTAGGFETLLALVTDFRIFLDSVPNARVVNMSIGYNTGENDENPLNDAALRQRADDHGDMIMAALRAVAARRPLPVFVVSAGNDRTFFPNQVARHASPYANAGLRDAAPIIVVEGLENNFLTGKQSRADYSNSGGHVSAPGSAILSTMGGPDYELKNGTSQAAPHVTGLVAYLYVLSPTLPAPTMTSNPVRDLLIRTAKATTGAAPMIDAFAAALEVDAVLGNDNVLRALLDIDDGTLDGNTRVGAGAETEDADGNGGRGDGVIDMSDFRRWRDWLLQAGDDPTLALDGPATHPKRDLNGDGRVETPEKENIYPRGDFNGDGRIDQVSTAPMPGALAGASKTDLEVLRSRFSDPHYDESSLPGLVRSVDITVDAATCFSQPGVTVVLTEIKRLSNPDVTVRARIHRAADGPQMFTEREDDAGFRIIVSQLNENFQKEGVVDIRDVQIALGADHRHQPGCSPATIIHGSGVSVLEDPACTNRQVVRTGLSANIPVMKSCTLVGAQWTLSSLYDATIGRGVLQGSINRTGTASGNNSAAASGNQNVSDVVTISAPDRSGTGGTATITFTVSGTFTASGPCGHARAFYFLNGLIAGSGVTSPKSFSLRYEKGVCFTSGSPPTTQTVTFDFIYGTPFKLEYGVQALARIDGGASTQTASSTATVAFRWMGLTGLATGATVSSALGVNWRDPIP